MSWNECWIQGLCVTVRGDLFVDDAFTQDGKALWGASKERWEGWKPGMRRQKWGAWPKPIPHSPAGTAVGTGSEELLFAHSALGCDGVLPAIGGVSPPCFAARWGGR